MRLYRTYGADALPRLRADPYLLAGERYGVAFADVDEDVYKRQVYANGYAIRVEFFGDEIDRISEINPVTGQAQRVLQHVAIYPASHYVTTKEKMERAVQEIERELAERKAYFEDHGKLIEAQRIMITLFINSSSALFICILCTGKKGRLENASRSFLRLLSKDKI